jgi:hypothetical protein
MVLLLEMISGDADDLKIEHKEISLFCDLNSIYSGINLKLWNIKENNSFFDVFQSYKKIRLVNF